MTFKTLVLLKYLAIYHNFADDLLLLIVRICLFVVSEEIESTSKTTCSSLIRPINIPFKYQ